MEVSDGASVAREILRHDRGNPLVVVSHDSRYPDCAVDAAWIAAQLESLATVHTIEHHQRSGFETLLPHGADLYGNAVRVYEPGAFVTGKSSLFLPRPALSPGQARWATQAAVDDAMRCTAFSTPRKKQQQAPPMPRTVEASIRGFSSDGTTAYAMTTQGALVTIDSEATIPGVRLDWILETGQSITGNITAPSSQIDISALVLRHRLSELYRHGETVLALVGTSTPSSLELTLFPGFSRTLKTKNNPATPENTDFRPSPGEVVHALYYLDRGAVRLSLDEAEPSSTLPAPPLLKDGSPWLVLGRDLPQDHPGEIYEPPQNQAIVSDPAPETAPGSLPERDATPDTPAPQTPPGMEESSPAPALGKEQDTHDTVATPAILATTGSHPSDHEQIARLNSERNMAREEAAALRHHLVKAEEKIRALLQTKEKIPALQKEISALRKRIRTLEKANHPGETDYETLFLDEKDALKHEIYSVWTGYIPPADKTRYPAPSNYVLGDHLAESLNENTTGSTRTKAIETIIDILVNRAERRRSLVCKPWLDGKGASRPQLVRYDGATAWRAYIEHNTPGALRLKYWITRENRIEISGVLLHEDYRS